MRLRDDTHAPRGAILVAAVLLELMFWPSPADADETVEKRDQPPWHVVLISAGADMEDVAAILENTRSQLDTLPVTVSVEQVDALPTDEATQGVYAEALLTSKQAVVVFWCDNAENNQVRFLYRTADGIKVLTRGLEGSGKEGKADAVGLIAAGTLRFLIREGAFPSRAETAPPSAPPPSRKSESAPPMPPRKEPPHHRSAALLGTLGFVSQMATTEPVFTNGGRLSLTLSIHNILRVFIGVELFTPVTSHEGAVTFERFRIPFHLGIAVMFPVRQWHLGASAAAVFSAARHTPKSENENIHVKGERTRFISTMELIAQAERRLSRYLGLFIGAGAEIFFTKVTYEIVGGPTLFESYQRVQPKAILGVTFYF